MADHIVTINRRVIRRSALWIIGVLAALPLLGQVPPNPGRPRLTTLSTLGIMKGSSGYQPLDSKQRLLYALNGLKEGALDVRYLVNGSPHLTEVVDVSNVELPERQSCGEEKSTVSGQPRGLLRDEPRDYRDFRDFRHSQMGEAAAAPAQVHGDFRDKGRMLELLARNPEHVRELHRLAGEGAAIDVEFSHSGRRLESISFDELVRRSGELRGALLLPVVAVSDVRGPGIVKRPAFSIKRNDYLPDCSDCTTSTPCDTECGYDPGKGGPVTCGEYGVCATQCQSQWTWDEYWTGWYFYGSGNSGYGQCYVTEYQNRWHNEFVTVYRRDRVRQTMNCPNAPSCDGCYITEQVIGYQLLYQSCLYPTSSYCSPAYTPCCGALCTVYPWTPCSNDWPC